MYPSKMLTDETTLTEKLTEIILNTLHCYKEI